MNHTPATLADGTYSYARPAMWGRQDDMTATIEGGQLVAGTLNGQPMTGHCWTACTLADLNNLPHTFTPAVRPIGKARAARLHRLLSRFGLGSADHYRLASAALGRTVLSLAALLETDARQVWNHARRVYSSYRLTAA